MITIDNNTAQAYFYGMLVAAFGICVNNVIFEEWQIDAVKKCALILKEADIDHLTVPINEKQTIKEHWKLELEAYTQGFKDELRKEGRLVK